MTAALQTIGLEKRFGGIRATDGVSLALQPGARHALIGPNGAGKTTLINLLTGVLRPSGGRVLLAGRDITAMPRHRRARQGLQRTFQINQLFAELTPLESLLLAIAERRHARVDWWRPIRRDIALIEEAHALLDRLGLADCAGLPTSVLSYGQQRLLEIALALASKPTVLLLDEPAAGIPEGESAEILSVVGALPREVTILLIEHDMALVFSFAERISVMVGGAILTEGEPGEVARDPRVRAAYLGEEAPPDG